MPRSKEFPCPSEHAIQAQILAYLAFNGILAYRINSGMIRTDKGGMVKLAPAGFSDIFAVLPTTGKAVFIEVKKPGNKPTELQTIFLERMKAQGAVAFWADDLDTVINELDKL